MKERINEEELELVCGGTKEEVQEIIDLFRKYGFEAEAKKLEKSGYIFFGDALSDVLGKMGFNHKVTVYADEEKQNYNFINGGFVGRMKFAEILSDFLYCKKNGIETEW